MKTIYENCKHWAILLILLVWTPIMGWAQTKGFEMVVEKIDGTELTFTITDDLWLGYRYGGDLIYPNQYGEVGVNTLEIQTADGKTSVPCPEIKRLFTRTVIYYTLTYMVDGEEYKSVQVNYGEEIVPEIEPTKEGYTFSGWGLIPEKMPAHDVTITGTFTFVDSIEGIIADDGTFQIYTLEGKQIESMQKGVNIIKYKNGGTQRIHVK